MTRLEDRDRPAVERRDPADAETLGGRDQQGVRQSRPMLCGGLEVLGGTGHVGVGRGDEPDPAAGHRPDQCQRRVEAQLALEQDVQLGQREVSQQQGLVGPPEPGDRGVVVQVGLVRGRQHGTPVEEDRHAGRLAGDGPAAHGLTSGDRTAIERQATVLAPPDREEGQVGRFVVLLEERLDRGRDDRRPRGPLTGRVPPDALEQVGSARIVVRCVVI